jgi:2-methylisocitrate lyase-like PEP mutase family enzyme
MNLDQQSLALAFHALHKSEKPLVLHNIWDAGSARAVAKTGTPALATSSWAVAAAHGYEDGEQVPFDFVVSNIERISRATALPVTVDLETGYGETRADLKRSIAQVIKAGAIGLNIEDGLVGGRMRDTSEQAERLAAIKDAISTCGVSVFINARIDLFFQAGEELHAGLLADVSSRMNAYAAAGADGIFFPGLVDPALIESLCRTSALPINLMVGSKTPPLSALEKCGVARISHGPGPYLRAMSALQQSAQE